MIHTNPLHAEIAKLRQQLADRDATIAEMMRVDADQELRGVARLSANEAKIVACIVKHGRVARERVVFSVWGNTLNPPEPKTIDVTVCHARKKLAPHGITIKTIYNYGYEMDRESADRLRALAAPSPSIVPTLQEMVA